MKLKALFMVCSLMLGLSAHAQFYPARVQVQVLPGQVVAQVFNPVFQPVICNGQVFGRTTYGQVFTTYFAEQLLLVGGWRYAYVQTTPFQPFVQGWANIHCRPAGWY